MRIVYVGLKEFKADNVGGTGLTWKRGEVHEVEEEEKAAKLLAHPLIWQDADSKYELLPEPVVVPPEPRLSFMPADAQSPYWEPIVMTVPTDVFTKIQKKELVAVFMTSDDADLFSEWKLERENQRDLSPKNTGPTPDPSKMDRRSREYKEWVSKQGLEEKKVA